jgi:tRNA threonylcarbamoyladenosine biosynthesis protein TsaE
MDFELTSNSAQQTIEIGRRIGAQLKGGEVIGLIGPLGSGKTYLIKGIAAGLGAKRTETAVHSPTFVIVNEYAARLPGPDFVEGSIYHIDAYRLNSIAEFEMIGFDECCRADSVVLIEWADRVEPALKGLDWVRIELSHLGPDERALHITNAPGWLIG